MTKELVYTSHGDFANRFVDAARLATGRGAIGETVEVGRRADDDLVAGGIGDCAPLETLARAIGRFVEQPVLCAVARFIERGLGDGLRGDVADTEQARG